MRDVLADPQYRERAQRMSLAIAAEAGTVDVVDELEAVAGRNGATAPAAASR